MRQLTAKSLLFNCTVTSFSVTPAMTFQSVLSHGMTFQSCHDFSVTVQSCLSQTPASMHACSKHICFTAAVFKKNSKSQFAIIRFDQLAMPWICNGIPDHVVKSEWQTWKDPVSGVHELWQKVTWYSGWKDWKLGSIKQ